MKTKMKTRQAKTHSKGQGGIHAFQELRDRILDLRLAPGSILEDGMLGAELGLSRTPVREALTQLASFGLVEIIPNKGARVAPLEFAEAPELLESLELFQRAVNRWAALRRSESDIEAIEIAQKAFAQATSQSDNQNMGRANYDYHTAISRACGNRYLTDAASRVELRTARLVHVTYNSARNRDDTQIYYEMVNDHHERILAAIRERDCETADDLARQHTVLFRNRLLSFLGHSEATDFQIQASDKVSGIGKRGI